jgi:hypothetical protein
MERLGFGWIWRDIIVGLLTTSSTQVLLNGVPGSFINHQRGLRQGDPLSLMLFIIVMGMLNHLITKAAGVGLLQPLSSRSIQHRVSLYANDVVLFFRPLQSDINLILEILHLFGQAARLKTNIQKSSVVPIQCDSSELDVIHEQLPCHMEHFPIKYLGLPLSIKKLSRAQLQPIIDKLADLLPSWRADLMTRAGRAVHVQFVITTTLIYQAMTLDLPAWFIKAVDMIRRGYFWRGSRDAKRGHCLIS